MPILATILGILLFCGSLGGCFAYYPQYAVYSAKMEGEAEFAKATQNRQIIVQEAQAEKEAEVLKAEGTAQANKIIGDSLRDNPAYLKWLWVNKLSTNTGKTVVYVPTDGELPNLETGRIGTSK